MEQEITEWKVSSAKFQGYMKAKMEDLTSSLDRVKEHNKLQDTKIEKHGRDITEMKVKSGIIGTISGFLMAFIYNFIKPGG